MYIIKNKNVKKRKTKTKKKVWSRIITLGNTAVGKTSLIYKYTENTFSQQHLSTIGIDTKIKETTLENGKEIRVILTDTAGQEQYRSIASNYIKKADGILLVYDITDGQSFEGIKQWASNLKEEKEDNKPMLLIGNKSDLNDKRVVDNVEGDDFTKTLGNGIKFYETSCKTGENVEKAINDLAYQVYAKFIEENPNEERDNNIQLEKGKKGEKDNKKCC